MVECAAFFWFILIADVARWSEPNGWLDRLLYCLQVGALPVLAGAVFRGRRMAALIALVTFLCSGAALLHGDIYRLLIRFGDLVGAAAIVALWWRRLPRFAGEWVLVVFFSTALVGGLLSAAEQSVMFIGQTWGYAGAWVLSFVIIILFKGKGESNEQE